MNEINPSIVVSLITLVGVLYGIWRSHHQTPAQKEQDIIKNYEALFNQYRLRAIEQDAELTALEQELKNAKAILLKRELDNEAEVNRIKREFQACMAYSSELRRVARRHAPKDLILPEMNGHSSGTSVLDGGNK